jgi:hypothetical protein
MDGFAGIFLQMRARQADRFLRRILALAELDVPLAAADDG